MSEVEIFTKPDCGWAERNYAALIEKGVAFRTVMSCDAAGAKTSEFLALSPYGATPVLRLGEDVVWESAVMNEYIDERFPCTPLRPADPFGRAQVRLLSHHCDHVLMPGLNALARSPDQPHAYPVEAAAKGLGQLAEWWARRGADGPLWRGDQLSLVDIAYHTYFQAVGVLEVLDTGLAPALRPELAAWRSAIADVASIRGAREIARRVNLQPAAAAQIP